MLRLFLGVMLGVIIGAIVNGVVEATGNTIFPPPQGVNLTDPAQLQLAISSIPFEAKVMMLLAWFLGVLAGASSANLIAGRRAVAGRIASLLIFCFAAWTMTSIAYPAWFVAAACAAILLAAFLADRAFGRVKL